MKNLLQPIFLMLMVASISHAQNVGIGVVNPTSKLQVNGQIAIDQKNFGGYGGLLIKGDGPNSNYPNICFTIKNNLPNPADIVTAYIGGNINSKVAGSEAMDLTFLTSTNGQNGLTQRLLIKDNGNIGIGNTNPGFLLNFPNELGNKIALWGNSGNHYGLGIQGSLMQLYTDGAFANIAFGYGNSNNFNERMRIVNAGEDGMILTGRIVLRNGTNPLNLNSGAGVWLAKADNSGLLGFMGAQNNQNIGFYGGPGGWGFTYNALNSRIGIGNNNPNAPLAFAATLEKKITLYPGNTGDAGFGISGNRLQIFSDNPNADVAMGYDAAGVFNERFAVKPNGALAVFGNTGNAGQVLKSNGAGSTATWSSMGSTAYQFNSTDGQLNITTSNSSANLAGLHNQIITVTTRSVVIVNCRLLAYNPDNAFGGVATAILRISLLNNVNNVIGADGTYQKIGHGENQNLYCQFRADDVPPGNYTINAIIEKGFGDDFGTGSFYNVVQGTSNGNIVVQVNPK